MICLSMEVGITMIERENRIVRLIFPSSIRHHLPLYFGGIEDSRGTTNCVILDEICSIIGMPYLVTNGESYTMPPLSVWDDILVGWVKYSIVQQIDRLIGQWISQLIILSSSYQLEHKSIDSLDLSVAFVLVWDKTFSL